MFKTKDPRLCFQFIQNYIYDIQQQLDQCNKTLRAQKLSCPESLSCDKIDERLKEYIQSQQKRFQRKIDHQLTKFKETIQEKQLYNSLFNGSLTHEQVIVYNLSMILFLFKSPCFFVLRRKFYINY